jgi:hypothetical protein
MRTSFHFSLKRSTLIFRYPQAGRPITPSFGAKRTCRGGRKRFGLTLLTHSGHRAKSRLQHARGVFWQHTRGIATRPNCRHCYTITALERAGRMVLPRRQTREA